MEYKWALWKPTIECKWALCKSTMKCRRALCKSTIECKWATTRHQDWCFLFFWILGVKHCQVESHGVIRELSSARELSASQRWSASELGVLDCWGLRLNWPSFVIEATLRESACESKVGLRPDKEELNERWIYNPRCCENPKVSWVILWKNRFMKPAK